MTRQEALWWLAGLEKDCDICGGNAICPKCGTAYDAGPGKVPVLDLRELCPCLDALNMDGINHATALGICRRCYRRATQPLILSCLPDCMNCFGTSWRPKQGRDALYEAMTKAGWNYVIIQHVKLRRPGVALREVTFYKNAEASKDSDDWVAAVKAMKAVGYE